jgi:hypothetical protein
VATTSVYGFRYQGLNDPPHGPDLGKDLAEDIEAALQGNLALGADLDVPGDLSVGGGAAVTGNLTVTGSITAGSITRPAVGKASSTSSHTGFSSETASLTISNMVFKSGWAYRATMRGLIYASSSSATIHFRLRKTTSGGDDYGEFGRIPVAGTTTSAAAMANGSIFLYRSAGSDLTVDVVLTVAASTGTGNVFATSASPRFLVIEPCGPASDYSGVGVDVT